MSSQNNNERQLLESLHEDYRRAWHTYQLELSLQQTEGFVGNSNLRSDRAAADYRDARNALASFLLAENPQDDESAYAVRLANVVARSLARSQAA